MIIGQIITLVVIAILFIFSIVKLTYAIDETKPRNFLYIILNSFIVTILFMLTITLVLKLNDLETQVKNKCHEYEKIENIYKLKQ